MRRLLATLGATLALCASNALAQEPERSSYVFRYDPETSRLMLEEMTFVSETSLQVEGCTVQLQVNDPMACALNCEAVPVCLLAFEGPTGLEPEDVLAKVEEVPVTDGASESSALDDFTGLFRDYLNR